jgi:type II secretory pathway pseudopilin PulG
MKKPGVTIIEILTAAAVFSVAIIVLLGTFSLTLRHTQHAKNVTVAVSLAQETIERLRLDGYDSLGLSSDPTPTATDKLPGGYVKTYVEFFEDNDKIKEVTVQVYWLDRPEDRAVSLTTLIGQGGVSG